MYTNFHSGRLLDIAGWFTNQAGDHTEKTNQKLRLTSTDIISPSIQVIKGEGNSCSFMRNIRRDRLSDVIVIFI